MEFHNVPLLSWVFSCIGDYATPKTNVNVPILVQTTQAELFTMRFTFVYVAKGTLLRNEFVPTKSPPIQAGFL
jgi:hypothetical protein